MQITITGHGMKITEALRDYVQEKTARLEEFFQNIQKAEVILDARHNDNANLRQVAEIRVWMAGKKMVQAKEGGKDVYAAFDLALEETKRQVERHKEKLGHEKRRQSKKLKILSRLKTFGIPKEL